MRTGFLPAEVLSPCMILSFRSKMTTHSIHVFGICCGHVNETEPFFYVACVAANDFDDDLFRPFICFYLKKGNSGELPCHRTDKFRMEYFPAALFIYRFYKPAVLAGMRNARG